MNPVLIGGVIFVMVILIIAVISFRSEDDVLESQEDTTVPQTMEEKTEEMLKQQAGNDGGAVAGEDVELDENAETEQAKQPPAEKEISEKEPDVDPKKVPGLVGHYTADSFDERENVWKDVSGKDNHANEVRGEPEIVEEGGVKFLMGSPETGIRFPTSVMTNGRKYTFVAVAKYNGVSGGGRLFDGYGNGSNYLAGYHWKWPWTAKSRGNKGGLGGAHRTGTQWIAHHDIAITDENVDDWVLTVDQKLSFRMNGVQRSGRTQPFALVPQQMTINYGDHSRESGPWWAQQNPEWSVAEVLFYNKELDKNTIRKLEVHLMKKYKIKQQMRPEINTLNSHTWEKDGYWKTVDDCNGGSSCKEQFQVLNKTGPDCGDEGALRRVNLHTHHRNHGTHGGNGKLWWESTCVQKLKPGVTNQKTNYVSISDEKNIDEKLTKLVGMKCRDGALNAFEFENSKDGSRMRTNYSCSSARVNENSCTNIQAQRYGVDIHTNYKAKRNNERNPNKGPFTALDTQALDCGTGRVLTEIRYAEDNNLTRLEGTCCNLEDE